MTKLKDSKPTHWAYWASGVLLSLSTIGIAPLSVEHSAALGAVVLLFLLGTVEAERAECA